MTRLISLAVLCLVGCANAPGDHYSVSVAPAFTLTEQEMALTSLERWHEAAGVTFDAAIGPCRSGAICIEPFAGKSTSRGPEDGEETRAGVGIVRVESGIDAREFSFVVRHEIGHALGLEHTQAGTVMVYAGRTGDDLGVVTCADVQQYEAIRGRSKQCVTPYQLTGR